MCVRIGFCKIPLFVLLRRKQKKANKIRTFSCKLVLSGLINCNFLVFLCVIFVSSQKSKLSNTAEQPYILTKKKRKGTSLAQNLVLLDYLNDVNL